MKKTVKRISAIIMICMIIISSLSFQVPDIAYAGDPLTIATTSTILEALKNVFTGVALGRAGLSSNSSTSDLIQATHAIEDDIMGGENIMQYLMSPMPWMQGINYTISKMFELSTYEEYCDYYDYDKTDRSILNLYITENHIGSVDQDTGNISISAPIVNRFSEFMRTHRTDMMDMLDDIIASSTNLPAFDSYYFLYNSNEIEVNFASICVEENVSSANYSITTRDFQNSSLPSIVQNALSQFVPSNFSLNFDITSTPFIVSTNGSSVILNLFPDNSLLFYYNGRLVGIHDYRSFIYMYLNRKYSINSISDSEGNTLNYCPYEGMYSASVNKFHPGYKLFRFDFDNNGWYSFNHYSQSYFGDSRGFGYHDYKAYENIYYVNFNNLSSIVAVNVGDESAANMMENCIYHIRNTPGATFALFQGVNIDMTTSTGISITGEDESLPVVPMELLDTGANVTIDPSKAVDINTAFEDGSTSGTAETYTVISPEIVESLASLLYKTSDIYKVVSVISGAISSTKSIVGNIKSGVEDLPTDISAAFSGYFTDSQTGETILSRLVPLSSIASVISNLPSWFVDQTTHESFASQTAAGVVGITDALDVSDIDIDDEDQEYPATIGGIMARIAAKVGEISTTLDGIAEDEEDDEGALDVPISISTAISTDVTAPNGKRSSNDINKLAILPLLFILILLLIIWLMLKVLAFVVLIFKTPVSTAFLSNGMISGLNWLKTTKITSGGGTLSMANGTGLAQAGSFINISIWSLMIFLVDLIALFAIVKVIKKWADRLHGG